MTLKGFSQSDYADDLLNYLKSYTPEEWQDKTVADILTIAQQFNINLENHYLTDGWKLGLSPNSYFNGDEYKLAWEIKHPEDTLDGVNPYLHYLTVGAAENINPSNSFDESDYINNVLIYYQHNSPEQWSDITYDQLKAAMASAGITALSFHIDYNIDESIFPVFAVPEDEAVYLVEPETISIDVGDLTTPKIFDASGKSFIFIEDPNSANNVEITGFSSDDLIKISNSRRDDYLFTSEGEDVIVSLNINDGTVSVIKLTGILEGKGDVILDGEYQSFSQALGFEAFV